MRDCAVCECEPDEVPACWADDDDAASFSAAAHADDADAAAAAKLPAPPGSDPATVAKLSRVDFRQEREGPPQGWSIADGAGVAARSSSSSASSASSSSPTSSPPDVWCIQDDDRDTRYVNLLANPEGYTGFAGPGAARIWQAIYGENCFHGPLDGLCLEERVMYRVLSGLQTSINTHIAMTYGEGKGVAGASDIYAGRNGAGHGTSSSSSSSAADARGPPVMDRLLAWLQDAWAGATGGAGGVHRSLHEAYAPGADAAAEAVSSSPSSSPSSSSPLAPLTALTLTPGLQPSVDIYVQRIGKHPDRLKNLYFAFLFLVRAVAKAAPVLRALDLTTGDAAEDARTRLLLDRLLSVEIPAVVKGFDETAMFRVRSEELLGTCPPVLHGLDDLHDLQERYLAAAAAKTALQDAFRDKFQNISRIMDCVGCEKCRLWGKLQFLGVGTALKILFADADDTKAAATAAANAAAGAVAGGEGRGPAGGGLHMTRNEAVALINVLHRLSMSISAVHIMRDLEARQKIQVVLGRLIVVLLVALAVVRFLVCRDPSRDRRRERRREKDGAGTGAGGKTGPKFAENGAGARGIDDDGAANGSKED
jgi:hypothetical protein